MGTDEPPPEATRTALRDVIGHCIYGVDINPMAVELCKVSLWMEALEPGKPLSFLDAHIKCGNSLVGVGPGMEIEEIPDDAFRPSFGDDKATATALRRRNKREREGQLGFRWDVTLIKDHEDLTRRIKSQAIQLEAMPEEEIRQVHAKAETYNASLESEEYIQGRLEYDLWTAAFFWPIPKWDAETMLAPTQQELLRLRKSEDLDDELVRRVQEVAKEQRFFHWEFEFPNTFVRNKSGFDVVLGNPPWDKVELLEKEWFAGRDLEIANASTAAKRKNMIKRLKVSNPNLYLLYTRTSREIDGERNFHRLSGRYPLCGRGRINKYAIFAENDAQISSGMVGIIIPSGIATDDTTKMFFQDIMKRGILHSLFEFENEGFFQGAGQGHMVRFCLFTLAISKPSNKATEFMFQGKDIADLDNFKRRFTLNADDLQLLNPNTLTCPIFRTIADADLARKIYLQVPVLENEIKDENPWGVEFKQGLFNMTSDSDLFVTEQRKEFVPLYESKMFYQFNHRHGDYGSVGYQKRKHVLPEIPNELLCDPNYFLTSHYWVPKVEVTKRLKDKWSRNWLLSFRDVTDSRASVRTCIFSLLPRVGVGNNAPLLIPDIDQALFVGCLLANFCSLVLDFIARLKLSGLHLNFFIAKQLPVIPPISYSRNDIYFISQRVIELVYTAWDLRPFAQDMGYEGPPFRWDEKRRVILRAELDAYYARLYGLNRKQLRYILDPTDLTHAELEDILDPYEEVKDPLDPDGYATRSEESDFPGETFRVLKEKEIRKHGEYRTRRLVLEAWDRMQEAIDTSTEYVPMVDPPPADPSVAHPMRDGGIYEGPGFVPVFEPIDQQKSQTRQVLNDVEPTAIKETFPSKPTKGESLPIEYSTQTSDYTLYKCEVCGQMVMGFDQENHTQQMHGGEDPGYVKL